MRTLIRTAQAALVAAGIALVATACGSEPAPPPADDTASSVTAAEAVAAPASTSGVEIAFSMAPDPPAAGDSTFDVAVTDAGGQPVTDAEVSVRFYMAAMPAMNMPEMQNTTSLTHQGGGRYRGSGQVVMAGDWEMTVTATRAGEEIGQRTLQITAAP